MTRDDAESNIEYHANGGCTRTVGPRGGVTETREVWRRNGATKTWIRKPDHFQIPIKYGFRGPYNYITQNNVQHFHTRQDCPLTHAVE